MAAIAVAAVSARLLAQAGVSEGLRVFALDLFGDRDTRQAGVQWLPIGTPALLRIDGEALLDALQVLARRGDVQGWVAGAGFEAQPELLEAGAALLPLCGTAAAEMRRVRDPRAFFACLDEHAIDHPPVRHERIDAPGWLLKDAGGCGGWHIRHADGQAADGQITPRHYWQREVAGTPMSATFIANGRDAVVLGINEQVVRSIGGRPFVFHGVIGPLPVADAVRCEVAAIARALAEAFALRGLCSLDFLLDGAHVRVLEVNPRPPASVALYPDTGVMQAHLRACRHGELPSPPQPSAVVHGTETVFAAHALHLDDEAVATLARLPDTHDLPHAAGPFAAGDPVCSLSARGPDALSVKIELRCRREALQQVLERFR